MKITRLTWVERSWKDYFDSRKEWEEASRQFWLNFNLNPGREYWWLDYKPTDKDMNIYALMYRYYCYLHHRHPYLFELE